MDVKFTNYLAFPLVVLLFVAFLFFFIRSESRKRQSTYPKSYPLIGSSLELIRNSKRIILWTAETFEKLSSSTYVIDGPFGEKIIFTRNPSNVKHILKTRFNSYRKESTLTTALSDLFRKGLFMVDGAEWKSQRHFMLNDFNLKNSDGYVSTTEKELISRLLPFLCNAAKGSNTTVDLQDVFRRLTFDLACQLGFGFDPEYLLPSLPATPFADAYETAVKLSMRRVTTFPLLWKAKKFFNTKSEKRLGLMVNELHTFIEKIIEEKKEKLSQTIHDDHFIERMLRNEQPEAMPFLVQVVVNFILGGQDTLCSALTWFFWFIIANPRVEEEIVKEITAVGSHNLNDMVYTHASIFESMRLCPPVPIDSKEAAEDDIWPDGTTKVKKGTRIVYHILAMGRSAELWGSDWADFRPERWLEIKTGNSTTATLIGHESSWKFMERDPFTNPVFQAGPRTCIGKHIAILQIKMVAATILKHFRLIPAHGNFSPNYDASMTSKMKDGFPVKIIHRQ